jgi:hypothetical protein
MAHHVQVTVPPEHAPAVHEALLSAYGGAAETVAEAAGHRDPQRLRDAREALLDADSTVATYGWAAGERLDAAQLAGSALFVHRVLGTAVDDATGTFGLTLAEYTRGEASLEALAAALAALTGLFELFASVERSESV